MEVFTTAVMMKKNRPGTLLTVLCREAQKEAVVQAIFKHTATIGIRETLCRRYVLTRTEETVETALGPVRLNGELDRTTFQLRRFADIAARGVPFEQVDDPAVAGAAFEHMINSPFEALLWQWAVLVFIGAKIFLVGIIGKIPAVVSLSVTLVLLVGGVLLSLYKTRGQPLAKI